MIITKDGYIINYKKRETIELISGLNNTNIDGILHTTYTLPKFLKIIDETNKEKVVVLDYLKKINNEMSFKQIYDEGQFFSLNIKDIFLAYIHINKDKYITMISGGQRDYINLILLSIITENLTKNISDIDKILIEGVEYDELKEIISYKLVNEIDKQIVDNKENISNYISKVFPITQVKPQPYSKFIKEEENINLIFDEELSLFTIFDNLQLSSYFPFSTYNKYVKIYNKLEIKKAIFWNKIDYSTLSIKNLLKIAEDKQIYIIKKNKKIDIINRLKNYDLTSEKEDEKIIIKYLIDKKYENKKNINIDFYREIQITIKNNKLYINFSVNRKNSTYIVDMIKKLLKLTGKRYTTEIKDFTGKFFFVSDELLYLNYSIFSHLCMHIPYYIKINEFINASTKSNTLKLQYTQYKNIDVSIKNNIVTNINKDNDSLRILSNGTFFIEVNILFCDNIDQLNYFINDLGIILQIYKNEYDNLRLFYESIHNQLNSSFNIDKNKPEAIIYNKDDITTLVNNKTKDKQQTYTKVCSKQRKSHLKIVNDIDFSKFKKIYPDFNDYFFKLENSENQYMLWPKDDPESYLLYCEDDKGEWIYPGVTKDSYYPCCFLENQIETSLKDDHKPSIKSYYYDMEKDTSLSYNIKGPKKVLTQPGKTGDLLTNILLIVGEKAKRKSVKIDKTSFVECLKSHPLQKTVGDIDSTLILGKLSNYEMNITEFKQKLENNILDCRNFTTFFEYLYNIYIITFDYNGNIIIPKNNQGYIDFLFEKNIIFLYENIYNNNLQYEYIINTKETIDYKSILKHRFSYYSLGKQILPFKQLKFKDLIKSQYIDQYGKCRIIKIIFDKKELYAQTFLPPLQINYNNILNNTEIKSSELLTVKKFITTYDIQIISQYIYNNKCIELYCKIESDLDIESDVYLTFKLDSVQIFTNIPNHNFPKIINSTNLVYNNFLKFLKISKSLQEYCLYLFSKLNIPIDVFFTKHIIYKPSTHTYIISKNFKNTTFIENDTLIISGQTNEENIEITKRLKSYIKLYLTRKNKSLIKYKNKSVIDKLYLTISDFIQHSNQYIFMTNTISITIDKNIKSIPITYNNYSYFIKFNLNIYLTCDTLSLSNAIYISNTWNNHNYNYLKSDKFSPLNDYIIYDLYQNVLEKKGNSTHNILYRVINDTNIFSPLLSF